MASLFGGMFRGTTEEDSCEFPRRDSKVSQKSGLSSFLNNNFFKRRKSRFLNKTLHNGSPKILLAHEVMSPVSNTIVNKKLEIEVDDCCSKKACEWKNSLPNRNNNGSKSEEEFGSQCFEINNDILILSETASEDFDSFRVSIGSAESFYCEDHASYFTLSDFSSSKVNFEIEEDVKLEMVYCEKDVQEEVCAAYMLPFKPQSPAKPKSFLAKTTPPKFLEVNYGASSSSNCSSNSTSLPNSPDRNKVNQEVSGTSFRELPTRPKLRKSFSSENKANTDVEENDTNEEESDNTLCKKKILMGRKCQPLHNEHDIYKTVVPRVGKGSNYSISRNAAPKVAYKSKLTSHQAYKSKLTGHQDLDLQSSLYRFSTFSLL